MTRIVIGIGNPTRGDDAAGLEVARRLRYVKSHQRQNGSYELMDLWEGADDVILVDAARSGAIAGTIHRLDPGSRPLPRILTTSTHSVGVLETIEMARTLGCLPEKMIVYGIEVANLAPGERLSLPVENAVNALVEEIDHA